MVKIHCWDDSYDSVEGACPEDIAPCHSKVTFSWVWPFLEVAQAVPLRLDLLYATPERHSVEMIGNHFTKLWDKCRPTDRPLSVKRLVWNFLKLPSGKRFLGAIVWKLPHDILLFAGPFILAKVLQEMEQAPTITPLNMGLVGALFVALALKSLFLQQYLEVVYGVNMDIRTGVSSLIYAKVLRLAPSSLKKFAPESILALATVDAEILGDAFPYFHHFWSAPLQIVGVLFSLVLFLGWVPSGVGLGVLACFIPLLWTLRCFHAKLQFHTIKCKEAWITALGESLQGLQIFKILGWNEYYHHRLSRALSRCHTAQKLLAVSEILYPILRDLCYVLVPWCALAMYSKEAWPTTKIVFPALALFNIAKFPFTAAPHLLSKLRQSAHAAKRVCDFLSAEEVDATVPLGPPLPHLQSVHSTSARTLLRDPQEMEPINGTAVQPISDEVPGGIDLDRASFAWDSTCPATLQNVNLKVATGSLVCVIGLSGSGKSSLLQALAGSMHHVDGTVSVSGPMGYCAQSPWIENGTARDNIVGTESFDLNWYMDVLKTCGLDPERLEQSYRAALAGMGMGMASSTLLAMVGLARVAYRTPAIALLDYIPEAVEGDINECVLSFMKDSTRVVVTSNPEILSRADKVLVMEGGTIKAQAPYSQLDGSDIDIPSILSDMRKQVEIASSQPVKSYSPSPQTEDPRRASISWWMFKSYGWFTMGVVLFWHALFQAAYIAYFWTFSQFTSHVCYIPPCPPEGSQATYYLIRLAVIGGGMVLVGILRYMTFEVTYLKWAADLHQRMLSSVWEVPMDFYSTMSVNSFVPAFIKDQEVIMSSLRKNIDQHLDIYFKCFGVMVLAGIISPFFLIGIPFITLMYYFIAKYHRCTSQDLSALQISSRDHFLTHMGTTLQGATTIRAHGVQVQYVAESQKRIAEGNRAFWMNCIASRWQQLRLEFVGSLAATLALLLGILAGSGIHPAFLGLFMVYALTFADDLSWIAKLEQSIRSAMPSVRRSRFIEETLVRTIEVDDTPSTWPSQGTVEWKDVQVRGMFLTGINLTLKDGEKLGILGLPGAGRNYLMGCLTGLLSLSGGTIVLDGYDIHKLGPDTANGFTIHSSTPMVRGTLGENLDPLGLKTPDEVSEALKAVGMQDTIQRMSTEAGCEGLHLPVEGQGRNFSPTQQQALLWARTILNPAKVLIIDEGQGMESEGYSLSRRMLRDRCSGTTICLANDVATLKECDTILILEDGNLVELGTTTSLLEDPDSQLVRLTSCQD